MAEKVLLRILRGITTQAKHPTYQRKLYLRHANLNVQGGMT
eukprot:COSAG01_NODE_7195_length_3308_cov_1715.216578_2_plen_41_part_00